MKQILKAFYRDIKDPYARLNILLAMLRETPGTFGQLLRQRFWSPYFGSIGPNVRIHQGVRFRNLHQIYVAEGVEIGVDCFLQGGGCITLGQNVMLGPGTKIWSVNHRFTDVDRPIVDQGYDQAAVTIGDGCWLAANVFVLPGVELPEGCVVCAGSVVGVKKYPPYSIIGGFPARVIGNRRQNPGGAE